MKVKSFSHVQLFVAPWTAAYQAPPSLGFSRQEYWNGVPLPSLNRRKGGSIVPLYHPSQGRATLKDKQNATLSFFFPKRHDTTLSLQSRLRPSEAARMAR